jgi:hypothetical protein
MVLENLMRLPDLHSLSAWRPQARWAVLAALPPAGQPPGSGFPVVPQQVGLRRNPSAEAAKYRRLLLEYRE